MPFLFASAIDSSCPTLAGGARLDQLDRTGHYARWEEDLEHAHMLGLDALWYGAPYYRTHLAPDHHEWECVEEPLLRLRDLGVEVIADLCRFGVPSWLGGFQDPAFPVLFAEYARAFARRFPWVRYFTPVSDIMQCATASALRGEWNECERSDSAFVRALRNLCMAHELAVESAAERAAECGDRASRERGRAAARRTARRARAAGGNRCDTSRWISRSDTSSHRAPARICSGTACRRTN